MRYFAFLCFVIALYLSSHAGETEGAILKTLNLRLTGEYSDRQVYKEFIIAQLRRSLPTKPQQVYNLPVLSQIIQGIDFLYLRLTGTTKNRQQVTVTLAMDVASLYILGSAVYGKTQNISFFFADVPKATREKLFGDTIRKELSYKGDYGSLGNRSKVEIGIPAFITAIINLVLYTREPSSTAFLVVVQMISEAARFKYIERKISERPGTFPTNFIPNPKFISLENKWSKLSKQTQFAVKNKGVFPTPVPVRDEGGNIFYVKNVNSPVVTEDIAILLNSGTPVDRDNDIEDDRNSITMVAPSEVMVETGEGDDEATAVGGCGHVAMHTGSHSAILILQQPSTCEVTLLQHKMESLVTWD